MDDIVFNLTIGPRSDLSDGRGLFKKTDKTNCHGKFKFRYKQGCSVDSK